MNFSAFKNLFSGIGFGKTAGSGGALASALPFLGASIGSSLGGVSTLGRIVGGVGGAALGIELSATPAIFGAGGALASPTIAALFSNPFTAIAGGALLVGAIFLGKAAQRKKDEEASGVYLREALENMHKLKGSISRDEIEGSQAKQIFEQQIIGTFVQQISALKTKSVRESRLTNQVRDLRNSYAAIIQPAIDGQAERRQIAAERAGIDNKLVPEFAAGGIVRGIDRGYDSVLSFLRPGEMVLTKDHQTAISALAGSNVFQSVGVPGVQSNSSSAGGFAQSEPDTIIVNLDVSIGLSESQAEEIVVTGVSGSKGRNVVVKAVRHAQRFGEIN